MHEVIYYSSYLAIVFALFLLWALYRFIRLRHRVMLWVTSAIIVLTGVFIWARFIEPTMLQVVRSADTEIGINKRVALIADMHLGVYNDEKILARTVEMINKESVDAVLIAGDFTYHPKDMKVEFAPLVDLKVPIYAVLGNHDLERPGPKIRDELESVLRGYGVVIINNQSVEFGDGVLVGLGDNFAGEDDTRYLDEVGADTDKPIVVMTHNPDTVLNYSSEFYLRGNWLTLTGHTHCGQVRVPILYKYAIDNVVEGEWYDGGYYNLSGGTDAHRDNKLYITCGIGEVSLPLRLNNPPTVDILDL
jgi:uncharacterized protein